MKKGIIIPCYNIEQKINLSNILTIISFNTQLHFCFVNNGSSDNTLEVLEYLKKESEVEVSILDIKKRKGNTTVVRAGARFLSSNKDLEAVQSMSLDFSLELEGLRIFFENKVLQNFDFTDNSIYKLRESQNKKSKE